jgi:hypothetical protein
MNDLNGEFDRSIVMGLEIWHYYRTAAGMVVACSSSDEPLAISGTSVRRGLF